MTCWRSAPLRFRRRPTASHAAWTADATGTVSATCLTIHLTVPSRILWTATVTVALVPRRPRGTRARARSRSTLRCGDSHFGFLGLVWTNSVCRESRYVSHSYQGPVALSELLPEARCRQARQQVVRRLPRRPDVHDRGRPAVRGRAIAYPRSPRSRSNASIQARSDSVSRGRGGSPS